MFDDVLQKAYDCGWMPTTHWKDAFKPPLYEVGDKLYVNYCGITEELTVSHVGIDTQKYRAVYTCASLYNKDAVILVPEHLTVEPVKTIPYVETPLHRLIRSFRRWRNSKAHILSMWYRRLAWKLTPRFYKVYRAKRAVKAIREVICRVP